MAAESGYWGNDSDNNHYLHDVLARKCEAEYRTHSSSFLKRRAPILTFTAIVPASWRLIQPVSITNYPANATRRANGVVGYIAARRTRI